MLTRYQAAILASQSTVADPTLAQPAPAHNRIGAALVVLSLVLAIGLLYAAFFSDRGPVSRTPQAAPTASIATPVIHPVASGFPEAALFLRHRPLEGDKTVSVW